jgi:putative membrane protein
MIGMASFVAAGVAALLLAWSPALGIWGTWNAHGMAGHMLQHLVVMNVAALMFAVALRPNLRGMLAISTVLQIALLWGWHVPSVHAAASHEIVLTLLMQASLLALAFLFWSAVLAHPVEKSWQTILATLVTAKASCLFGAVLCFARHPLYPMHGDPGWGLSALDDQQLAGLLMMASCAVVYVVAAVALFLRWMGQMGRKPNRRSWLPADA